MYRAKHIIITFLATITLWGSVAYAQEATEEPAKGVHPYKVAENENVDPTFSHWSLILDAGFNSFDGDFNSEMKHPVYAPAVGLSVEYTFNPYIGLGVSYMFDMYRVTGNGEARTADILLNGMMHKAGLYLPIELASCFVPNAQKRIFNLQLIVGGGGAWYKSDTYFQQADRHNTANVDPLSMDKYKFCPYYNIGANFEFNLSRSIALGIRGNYTYFTKDEIDGRYGGASTNNDGIIDVTVSLRYKIAAQKHSHERNITSIAMEREIARKGNRTPQSAPVSAEEVAQEIVEKGLLPVGKDTLVIMRKDTLVQKQTIARNTYHFVYFASGSATLTDQALIAIQQLATQLKHDTTLYAFITGYCDNTGSDEFNNTLSQRRADAVVKELVEEHNIDADRVFGVGAGKITGKRSKAAYTPNRRAEVQLLTAVKFNEMKQNTTAPKAAEKATIEETAPQSTTLDTVVVKPGMTLSKLARKYYKNTDDWTLIYEANKDVITNPDKLQEGITIVIPAKESK